MFSLENETRECLENSSLNAWHLLNANSIIKAIIIHVFIQKYALIHYSVPGIARQYENTNMNNEGPVSVTVCL